MIELTGKRILITGASSGIGKAVAILASKLGALCVITGRNEERLNSTYLSLKGTGHLKLCCELNQDNAAEIVSKSVRDSIALSGFVHCAGIEITQRFRITTLEEMGNVMQINFYVFWAMIQEFLKKKSNTGTGASIVGIGSVASQGVIGKAAYAASKGAVISLMKALASEYASKKIRFNCVSPGYVATPMLNAAKELYENSEDFDKKIASRHPLGIGEAEDVANAVVWLLSDASKWVTGSNMEVDGGYRVM